MIPNRIRPSFIAVAAASSLLLTACGGGGGSGSGSSQNWTYADYLQPKNSIAVGIDEGIFMPLEKDGDIQIEKFYQESLLKATDILPGVAQGRADLGFTVVLYYPGELPLSQLASVPYLATNAEAQAKAYNKLYAENKAFKAEYDKAGVHVISFTPLGGTIIGGTKKWENVGDLKGQSIRAAGYVANALKAAGPSLSLSRRQRSTTASTAGLLTVTVPTPSISPLPAVYRKLHHTLWMRDLGNITLACLL